MTEYLPTRMPQEMTLQQINAQKLAKAIEWLGKKWILHPDNAIKAKQKCCGI